MNLLLLFSTLVILKMLLCCQGPGGFILMNFPDFLFSLDASFSVLFLLSGVHKIPLFWNSFTSMLSTLYEYFLGPTFQMI